MGPTTFAVRTSGRLVKVDLDARDCLSALRRYYDGPPWRTSALDPRPWLLLDEVRLSAWRTRQEIDSPDSRIDALAVRIRHGNAYLIGHEIKVDRRDLESELANHEKREPWQVRTNEFYLVAPAGLTSAEEVEFSAPDLGLLEVVTDRATPRAAAEIRLARRGLTAPEVPPPDWALVVAMLRAASR